MISPRDHFCDVGDLSFDLIGQGVVVCDVCGRVWRRNSIPLAGGVWRLEPTQYGCWHSHDGGRFFNVRTGEVVEGPPPAIPQAQPSDPGKSEPAGVGAPTGSEVVSPSKE